MAAAAPTSGIAWMRSVPTISFDESSGYININMTMISEPEPTEVMPTIRPPIAPTTQRRDRADERGVHHRR